jgi:hypothetical protein
MQQNKLHCETFAIFVFMLNQKRGLVQPVIDDHGTKIDLLFVFMLNI